MGHGKNIHSWWDNCLVLGPLAKKYGNGIAFEFGVPLNTKLADLINDNGWCWPNAMPEATVVVQSA